MLVIDVGVKFRTVSVKCANIFDQDCSYIYLCAFAEFKRGRQYCQYCCGLRYKLPRESKSFRYVICRIDLCVVCTQFNFGHEAQRET